MKATRNIGQDIKLARELNEMTQRDLAKTVGCSRSYIAHIEQGVKRHIDLALLRKILNCLFAPEHMVVPVKPRRTQEKG